VLNRKEQAVQWSVPVVVWKSFQEVLWSFLCNYIYPQAALAFLTGSSMVGLGSQRIKSIKLTE
jgi:hypothetical protein